MLDGLMKLKPKDIDLNMNATLSMLEIKRVRDKLSKKKLNKALDFAKKSKSKQKLLCFKNKKNNSGKKTMKLKQGMQKKEKREKGR